MKGKLVASMLTVLILAAASGVYLGLGNTPQLGLDLKGGISAILSPVVAEGETVDTDILDQTIEVIRARVDSLGVAEPEIARQGEDVLIQLPGLQDEARAREVIGRTAKLTFRPVEAIIQPGDPRYEATGTCSELAEQRIDDEDTVVLCSAGEDATERAPVLDDEGNPVFDEDGNLVELPIKYEVGPAALGGPEVADALAVLSQTGVGFDVQLDLTSEGGDKFASVTSDLACRRDQGQIDNLAIVLDGVVESAPGMQVGVACGEGIAGGSAIISVGGGDDDTEAQNLALVLRTGALPITLEPSTFETVSPTLGAESLQAGILAGAIGLTLVAIYLIFFYRWLGLVSITALLVFGSLIVGIISLLGEVGFTLTLAGIAGMIVSVGITADSSIIYFERLRDEVESGRTIRTAVKRAFESAFRTNLAGNTVTLAAAVILYFLAVGPVRGFALTLGLATVLDILILYFFTRPAVHLLGGSKILSRRNIRAGEAAEVAA